jgi:hypothetical protein
MSMDKSDSREASEGKGPSMKERLLAQRKAEADAAAKSAADPKRAAAASRPAAAPAPAAASAPRARVGAAAAAAGAPSAAERIGARHGAAHPHTELSPDVKREVQLLKARESKTMTYVWIICGVLFLAAGGVLGNTLITRHGIAVAEKGYQESLDKLLDEVKRLDPLKEADAHQILDLANKAENRKLWKGSRIEGEVSLYMGKAQRTIDTATERRDMIERLDQLVRTAESAETQPMDTIRSARRTRQDLLEKSQIMDDDYKKRLADASEKLDRAFLTKLMADARAKGQTREALTAYTMAEIEIRNALDNTLRNTKDPDKKKWYQDLYRALLADSDAIAVSVFNPGVVDGEPWKDALTEEKEWLHSPDLVGFQVKDGQLHAVGAKAGSGRIGTLSVGDSRQLKDFVAQIEFTPVKGNMKLYFRVYNRMDSSEYYPINTMGKASDFKPGQSYTMEVRMIGSSLSVKIPNTDIQPSEIEVGATKQRFGSIGLALDEECELKITGFKYKELRSNKRQ